MADRDRERVGGVRVDGPVVLGQRQDRLHHARDLRLLGAPVAADRLLHAARRVLSALDAGERRGDEHCAARLPDRERGAGVGADERFLQGDGIRLEVRHQPLHALEDRLQAKFRALSGRRLPPPVGQCPKAAVSFVDDGVSARGCTRIDAENSHAVTLGARPDVPPP